MLAVYLQADFQCLTFSRRTYVPPSLLRETSGLRLKWPSQNLQYNSQTIAVTDRPIRTKLPSSWHLLAVLTLLIYN